MKFSVTTKIEIEKRTPLKDGRLPVKLRVTYQRKSRYYSLKNENGIKIALKERDFEKLGSYPRADLKELKLYLSGVESHARNIIDSMVVFSFETFDQRFKGARGDEKDMFSGFRNMVSRLMKEEKVRTAQSYKCAHVSLVKYLNRTVLPYEQDYTKEYDQKLKVLMESSLLPFEKVDIAFLANYESWMMGNGNSATTVGIYLRYVRALFNEAINQGVINKDIYPFGSRRYAIPIGANTKKPISEEQIRLIASYKAVDGSNELRYRDYWLFAFLCNGMNLKDVANLKYDNIDASGSVFTFLRAKTKKKNRKNPIMIKVVVTESVRNIIERWGNKPQYPDQYIFPILKEEYTPLQRMYKTNEVIKRINSTVTRIGQSVGIKGRITLMVARHSYGSLLKRRKAGTEFIKDSFGHATVTTTEKYLASFDMEEQQKWAEIIEKATR